MHRDQLEFNLCYSILLEEMHQTLMGRIDRLCTFAQLVLGCAVVAALWPGVVTGALVAVLASFQLVYQPAGRAMEAKIQKERYLALRCISARLTDDALRDALDSAALQDSAIPGLLTHAAWLAAAIQLDREIPAAQMKLGWREAWMAAMAGNRPRLPVG